MPASAALLFDRGLPTTNLNNAALGDRSNVGWGGDGVNLFTGDDFKIGVVGQTYVINSLTVWGSQVDPLSADLSQIALYVGKDGGPLSLLSSGNVTVNTNSNLNISHTPGTYSNGEGYQGWGGGTYSVMQTTFSGLNLVVEGGVVYNFGVWGNDISWYSHASNAALSGSTQQGADGRFKEFDLANLSSVTTYDSNQPNFWDKSSDINVRIDGNQIPEPTTMALMGLALAGLGVARRKVR